MGWKKAENTWCMYLELRGFSVGEIEGLEDVDYERHQVLHNVLVVPVQEILSNAMSQYLIY